MLCKLDINNPPWSVREILRSLARLLHENAPVVISVCTSNDRLLLLNEKQNRECNQDIAHPHRNINTRRTEQGLHWTQAGKADLEN